VSADDVRADLSLRVLADETANWNWVSQDVDGDGLANWIETGGWCNAAGCHTTDPLDADSDDD
jgi:hypothetical protein